MGHSRALLGSYSCRQAYDANCRTAIIQHELKSFNPLCLYSSKGPNLILNTPNLEVYGSEVAQQNEWYTAFLKKNHPVAILEGSWYLHRLSVRSEDQNL